MPPIPRRAPEPRGGSRGRRSPATPRRRRARRRRDRARPGEAPDRVHRRPPRADGELDAAVDLAGRQIRAQESGGPPAPARRAGGSARDRRRDAPARRGLATCAGSCRLRRRADHRPACSVRIFRDTRAISMITSSRRFSYPASRMKSLRFFSSSSSDSSELRRATSSDSAGPPARAGSSASSKNVRLAMAPSGPVAPASLPTPSPVSSRTGFSTVSCPFWR